MKRILALFLSVFFACGPVAWANGIWWIVPKPVAGISGTIAQWKFNDGTGTSVADNVSTNTGTITGTPAWGTGVLTLDGSTNFITVANEANFDFERTAAWSFSGWVKLSLTASGSDAVFNKQSPSGNEPGINIRLDTDNGRIKVYIIDNSGAELSSFGDVSSFSANAWHHIVVTYSGSSAGSGLNVYLDGSFNKTGTGTITQTILNDSQVLFGSDHSNGFLKADINDFRFFNRALNSTEVSSLYSGGAQ
jgi:hypothetical protein